MIHSDAMTANECLDFYRAGERVRHIETHGFGDIVKRASAGQYDVRFTDRHRVAYIRRCDVSNLALAGHLRPLP
jgi:hypothetical protein